MNERVSIIIDGSNFYHRVKELGFTGLSVFDYKKFGLFLAGKRTCVLYKYYVGAVREEAGNKKSKQLMANQQKLISHLKNQGWEIGFGHILKTDDYHEKGVDVLMATDMLVGAYENLFDAVILVSSDTDLIPAIKKARSKGKKVEYVGFSQRPSYGLIKHCDVRRLLTKEDIWQFFPQINTKEQKDLR